MLEAIVHGNELNRLNPFYILCQIKLKRAEPVGRIETTVFFQLIVIIGLKKINKEK